MKRFVFSILLLSGIVSLTSTAQEYMVFTPQWTAQAQFAGYYVAKEKGFYMKAGLDVEIIHPSVTQSAISRIRNNESQATTLQLAQALEIIDDGIPLVNILQTSMNNAMVIVSRRGMNPLKQIGAKVGIWNAGFGQVAMCMSMKDGLHYNWIPFASNVNLFISGAIDATLAMSYNEYYQLLQTGIEITPDNVYRFCDHGYNIQEDGVYMTKEYYEKHKDQAYRFAEASRQGWEYAVENPEETLDIVMEYVQKEHIPTNRVLQKLMLDDVLRLLVDRESKSREFRLRPDMVEQASRMMIENGMLYNEISYDDIIAK
ncbi:MAG: ABC transporter substrate-binding protein [Bacteroidaceae bacterium]|nr:ABC transporter substrate-binding protein [Bacteroidaceae bacterium]